jgi:iron(III) transport system ATP-binding protein
MRPFFAEVVVVSEMGQAFLDIREISKRFGDFWALKNVSLCIQPGEFVCFLGPSGCGKTTLLRIIAGLESQDNGSIIQRGADVSNLPSSKRDFGIVFQSYALFPNLNVRDNIGYGLKSKGFNRQQIDSRVNELLNLVGLPKSAASYPAEWSGGMQQRVALARALATSPGLLLLDEPLSALDARVRSHLRTELRQLHKRLGITTIMVTHDQEEALSLADRIVVMNHGVIEQVGTPQSIYQEPQSAFVADFVGKTNPLHVTVREQGIADWQGVKLLYQHAHHDFDQGTHLHTLTVRPEDVLIVPESDESADQHDNCVLATVKDMEFLGAFCRVMTEVLNNNQAIMIDVPTAKVATLGLHENRQITIALPSQRIRFFSSSVKTHA